LYIYTGSYGNRKALHCNPRALIYCAITLFDVGGMANPRKRSARSAPSNFDLIRCGLPHILLVYKIKFCPSTRSVLRTAPPLTMSSSSRPLRPIHSLVLDTAPLLTVPYGQLKSFNAQNYYTVPLAREEVRDETSRAALEIWGSELRVRQPSKKAIHEGIPHPGHLEQTGLLQWWSLLRKRAIMRF
jgi:hypothetical protein